ncbi:MAG: tetratricopeptide repeat protein [Spirochaetaceae bacterium]|jgi:tetratricopeptide (TPR) repeat protein|nr:tetratricopeptide repeat protein [Spirochaetaceae bacterium]
MKRFLIVWPLLFILTLLPAAPAPANPASYYEQGQEAMLDEDWYTATEALLECVRLNAAHAQATGALAECYYALGEFDQSLIWIRKARFLSRNDMSFANLEAFILIALGQLDAADTVLSGVLSREPYNKEALFASAELDIARGRSGDAITRYREAVKRFPDDRRLLISLALVLGSTGDANGAQQYIKRAMDQHPADYRVYYYAAYLESNAGNLKSALEYVEEALFYRPQYIPGSSLLASLHYRMGDYEEAGRIADTIIAKNRSDINAWYLKSMAFIQLGRSAEALQLLTTALDIQQDEFVRVSLEELLLSNTPIEDSRRAVSAAWHFDRAREYRKKTLIDQALFEYRRGLRLNPYAKDRTEYADLLRIQGYPARYLEELRFLQDLGMGDRPINDAIETYNALLENALHRRWKVNPVELAKRHWTVAVFSVISQSSFYHADAGATVSSYIKELLIHNRNMAAANLELHQPSFSAGFRAAREANCDYFITITVTESERDIAIKADLFVARTGSSAGTFYAYRTGNDRFRNAARAIVDSIAAAIPLRIELIRYSQGQGLIDKGKVDGVKVGDVFDIVKRGKTLVRNEGIGLVYAPADIVGKFTITEADEEVSAGSVSRIGFFDLITSGDEVLPQPPEPAPEPQLIGDPELRSLLRTLR